MTSTLAPAAAPREPLRRGLGFAAGNFTTSIVLHLGVALVSARLYGVEVIGAYALVIAPWAALSQLSTVSEQVAMRRRLAGLRPREPAVAGTFFSVLAFSTALTVVLAIPVLLLSRAALDGPIGQGQLFAPGLVVVGAYVLTDNVSWNLDSLLASFGAARSLFLARAMQSASMLALTVVFAAAGGRSVWSLTWATVSSFVVGLVARIAWSRPYLTRPTLAGLRAGRGELTGILRFGMRLLPGALATGLAPQASAWLLGSMAPVATVGAFARASGIAQRLSDAGFRVSEILLPTLVRHHNAGETGILAVRIGSTFRMCVVPLTFVVAVAGGARAGILAVFGDGFDRAAGAFGFLLVAYACGVLSIVLGDAFIAVGRPWVPSSMSSARAALMLAVMVPGIHRYGVTAAGGAMAVAYLADVGCRVALLRRAGLLALDARLCRTLVALLVVGPAAFVLSWWVDGALSSVVGTIAAMAAGSVAFVGLVWRFGFDRQERRAAAAAFARRFRRGGRARRRATAGC